MYNDRYEITRVTGEPDDRYNEGVFHFLDTQRSRAELLHISYIHGDQAHIYNLAAGHGSYYLMVEDDRWHCTCPAARAGRHCYHMVVAMHAAKTMLPQVLRTCGYQEVARANAMLRPPLHDD